MSTQNPGGREIRRVSDKEFLDTGRPLQAYSFGPSPTPRGWYERQRAELPFRDGHETLVAFSDGRAAAVATAMPMRQHVRGSVLPMAGVCSVTAHPEARRQGHARALLDRLHADMAEAGHVVATLYPFRSSFYQRVGYVGLPKPRRVRLFGDGLTTLPRPLDAPDRTDVTLRRIGDGFADYQRVCAGLLAERHGFCLLPDPLEAKIASDDRHWLAVAWDGDEPVGAVTYTIGGQGADLVAEGFLYRTPAARALLLGWLGRHVDQVASFVLEVPPDARPELWLADAHYDDETQVAVPNHNPPMARVLSVEGLAGLAAGPDAVTLRVTDDALLAGDWTLDGRGGALEVRRGGDPTGTVTAPGLAGLVYGVLDPADLPLRGFGSTDTGTGQRLRTIFPAATPYLFTAF